MSNRRASVGPATMGRRPAAARAAGAARLAHHARRVHCLPSGISECFGAVAHRFDRLRMTDPADPFFPTPDGAAQTSGQAADTVPGGASQESVASPAASARPVSDQGGQPDTAAPAEIDVRRRVRKRPKPGERRLQILQALAGMLEQPAGERVTTAALAARLSVSEAALYRHFASKAQMFEGLIEFIESTLFGLINQITREEESGLGQIEQIVNLLLTFSERNPGMTRVLVGDALINEDDRLQLRINQLTDRLELSLKQCVRTAIAQSQLPPGTDAAARADLILSYVLGRWMRYAKGGFKRMPTEQLTAQTALFALR